MRILVISNFYPPHHIGGYELGCRDVVGELRARGHDVRVLTSTYGVTGREANEGIYRWLKTSFVIQSPTSLKGFISLLINELSNRRIAAQRT